MEFLTKEAIIEANRRITSLYGDPFGVLNEANLEHAIESARHRFNKEDEFESLLLKAALILDLLANKGHCFIEGNKRTALSMCNSFLKMNGYQILQGSEETGFVLSVARDEQTIKSIAKWIEARVIKIETKKISEENGIKPKRQ